MDSVTISPFQITGWTGWRKHSGHCKNMAKQCQVYLQEIHDVCWEFLFIPCGHAFRAGAKYRTRPCMQHTGRPHNLKHGLTMVPLTVTDSGTRLVSYSITPN